MKGLIDRLKCEAILLGVKIGVADINHLKSTQCQFFVMSDFQITDDSKAPELFAKAPIIEKIDVLKP